MIVRRALFVLVLPLLASCGLQKPLDKPPPMFGAEREKYEAAHPPGKAEKKKKPPPSEVGVPPPPLAPIPADPLAPPPPP